MPNPLFLSHAARRAKRVKASLLTLCPLPFALRSFLLALCPLLFALCASSARAQTYSDTTFLGSVHTQGWSAISGISLAVTTGGYYTNSTWRTNYYRLSGTNQAGRIPTSTNIWISFLGSSSLSNAVQLTWTRPGGIQRQVVEKSYDLGSTWTNWLTIGPGTNTFLDTGSNTWTAGVFSNSVSAIPAATYPWPSISDFSALAETAGVTRIIADAASNLAAAASAASGSNTAWLASLAPSQAVDRAWLSALTPSQQVDRTLFGIASNLLDLTTFSGQVNRTMASGVIYSQQVDRTWLGLLTPSQQVDRAIIGNVSNALDAVKTNPRYVTTQAASELANEQVLSATDFRVENNRVNVSSRFDANDAMLAFKLAEYLGITALDLSGSLTWIFNNQSGVDLGQSANQTYVAGGGGYYRNVASGSPYCLDFDNSDDCVRLQATAQTLVTTALTWSVWHKFNVRGADWDMFFSAIDTSTFSIYPDVDNGGQYRVILKAATVNSGISPVEGQWVHYAVTYDKLQQKVVGYTNGVVAFSNTAVDVTLSVDATYGWCIGNYANGGGYAMNGKLDEPSMWDRSLTHDEVRLIWTNGPPGVYPDVANPPWNSGLVLAFHLDDATGSNAANYAAGNVAAGLENGPTWAASEVAYWSDVSTNMTLISTNIFGGTYSPTYARLLIEQENVAANITNNVDVMYWVSGNNGTNWDQIMLAPLTSFAATNGRVYLDGTTNWTMTALTNQWRWKVTTPGKKETRIYKANMGVGQ